MQAFNTLDIPRSIETLHFVPLLNALQNRFGETLILGMSTGPRLFVDLATAASADLETQIEAAAQAHNTLGVTADKTTITADGLDTATIQCSAPALAGDSEVTWRAWVGGDDTEPGSEGILFGEGVVSVSEDQVILTFNTHTPRNYLIEISRKGADCASGYVLIEAVNHGN